MSYYLERKRCIEQVEKVLDSICSDKVQHRSATNVLELIVSSILSGRKGDDQASKLFLDTAHIRADEAFGVSAPPRWEVLNQIGKAVVGCIDKFDHDDRSWLLSFAVDNVDSETVEGIVDRFARKQNAAFVDSVVAAFREIVELELRVKRSVRRAERAKVAMNKGLLLLLMSFFVGCAELVVMSWLVAAYHFDWAFWFYISVSMAALGAVLLTYGFILHVGDRGVKTCLKRLASLRRESGLIAEAMGDSLAIKAPLSGKIYRVVAISGQNVVKGDEIFVMDILGMATPIVAPRDGRILVMANEMDEVSISDVLAIVG